MGYLNENKEWSIPFADLMKKGEAITYLSNNVMSCHVENLEVSTQSNLDNE